MSKVVALWGTGAILVLIAAAAAAAWYMLGLPGKSFTGPPPPATRDERNLAERLKRHVVAIASKPHNVAHYAELERAAAYIEAELTALGYEPQRQVFDTAGRPVRNIEVVIPAAKSSGAPSSLVVGAHSVSDGDAPGANDNASGVALLLATARQLRDTPTGRTVRIVFFVNEEYPFSFGLQMGSRVYAERSRARGDNIVAMICVDSIGYYSSEPGSQKLMGPFFPSKGNFVAFVSNRENQQLLDHLVAMFQSQSRFPSIGAATATSG